MQYFELFVRELNSSMNFLFVILIVIIDHFAIKNHFNPFQLKQLFFDYS